MSVSHYSTNELAQSLAFLAKHEGREMGHIEVRTLCTIVATASTANCLAYAHTYGEIVPASTPDAIEAAFWSIDLDQDLSHCLGNLPYNCVSNAGKNFLPESIEFEIELLKAATRNAEEKAYQAEKAARFEKLGSSAHTVGDKYKATKDLSRTEVGRLIRKDVAQAKREGRIAKDVSFTMRKSGFSTFYATATVDRESGVYNPDHFTGPSRDYGKSGFVADIESSIALIESIASDYNFNNSDSQSDYFHTRFSFYLSVDVEHETTAKALDLGRKAS